METKVTEAGQFERLLTVIVTDEKLDAAKTAAARKMSQSLKIKGFRPGKAPRAVVERMVGADALKQEAIEEALPSIVGEAISETELVPVTTPQVADMRDTDGGVEVDVMITLWPTLDVVPDVAGRRITIEAPTVTDEELADQIERLRDRFAELEDVSRMADTGDFVTLNLTTHDGNTQVEDASASDLLYEIGSGSFLPGMDEHLVGASAGDIKEAASTLPEGFGDHGGKAVTLRMLVKGVKAKVLPDVTDEWVSDISEFDTVDELRASLTVDMENMKKANAGSVFRQELLNDIAGEVDLEIPNGLVQAEMEASIHDLAHRLEPQGIDVANYLRITGQSEEAFIDDLRARSTSALKTRVLLEAVARENEFVVTDDELTEVIVSLAEASKMAPDELRTQLEADGRVRSLEGDILRRKALDYFTDKAVAVDADGNEVDLTPLEIQSDDEDSVDDTTDAAAEQE